MDYKNKYLKYKRKYLLLKNKYLNLHDMDGGMKWDGGMKRHAKIHPTNDSNDEPPTKSSGLTTQLSPKNITNPTPLNRAQSAQLSPENSTKPKPFNRAQSLILSKSSKIHTANELPETDKSLQLIDIMEKITNNPTYIDTYPIDTLHDIYKYLISDRDKKYESLRQIINTYITNKIKFISQNITSLLNTRVKLYNFELRLNYTMDNGARIIALSKDHIKKIEELYNLYINVDSYTSTDYDDIISKPDYKQLLKGQYYTQISNLIFIGNIDGITDECKDTVISSPDSIHTQTLSCGLYMYNYIITNFNSNGCEELFTNINTFINNKIQLIVTRTKTFIPLSISVPFIIKLGTEYSQKYNNILEITLTVDDIKKINELFNIFNTVITNYLNEVQQKKTNYDRDSLYITRTENYRKKLENILFNTTRTV